MFKVFITALIGLLLIPLTALSQNWEDLRPRKTTEAEILLRYGEPPFVVIEFYGFDSFTKWRKGGDGCQL